MFQLKDTQTLTSFKRDTAKYVKWLKETSRPLALTVKGETKIVVQDAEAYMALLERYKRAEVIEAIRMNIANTKRGEGKHEV